VTESKRLNVTIVGGGAVSDQLHLPALTKLPSVCIYALVDKSRERASEMAQKFCLNNIITDYEDAYEHTDIALIALPNHLHAKAAVDFLEHDVNVLCEKPMATSVSDCKRMIAACEKSKAKLMIGHNKRFMSNVLFAKKMIESGGLGEITSYACKVGAKFRWPTQTGFYFKKGEAGGGVLIDMGVHIIDLLLWFFQDVKDLTYKAQDITGKGIEDNVFVSFVHENSVKGEFTLSRTELLENKLTIWGKAGWLKIDIFDTTFFEYNSKKSKASSEFGQLHINTKNNDPYRDQFGHFVDCIKYDKKPLISGRDGMKVIEIVEACYEQSG
jgi:predicted dehydrogenase